MPASKLRGITSHLVFAIAAAAIGASSQHGYNTGVVNAPQELVGDWINETYTKRFNVEPDKATIDFIYSVIVAIFCVGGMIGALMTAYVAERFGRKGGLLLNNVFVFIAGALMGFCKYFGSYEMLIAGRFFIGFNAGLNAGLTPMYLTEISPAHLRGAIGTVYQLVVVISILASNLLGLPSIFGTAERWPLLFGVTVIPAIFMLVTLPLCPESPKYMLIFHGKDVAAQKSLTWLRNTIEVHDEMDEMRAEYEALKLVPKVTLHEMWHNQALRQPLIIAMVLMLSQQLSGINAAIFFSTKIFTNAGLDETEALYSTLGMGVINVIMTLVSLVLVEKAGRRTLHLTGLAGMAVTTVVLTWTWFNPVVLVAELFGVGARGLATSLAVAVNWSANFAVGLGFLPLTNILGDYTFLVFTVLLVSFWFYGYKRMPETKGKSVDEISAVFRQKAYQ
ncbi:Solute carrier family 2, facilitated glucose transporter member 1 [Halotydeus destructor]|nr:Solute carrier family 2, facilitated glucose transporter member 1 [Halotydeus destructor]